MNHQPFRDWLLSEEKLSADQSQALQEHLHSCESCKHIESAWSDVEAAFQRIPHAQPAQGFTIRWQAYLADYQVHKQKRKGWMTIGMVALFVISLLVVVIYQLWELLQAPSPYLAAWFDQLINIVAIYYSLQNIVSRFSISTPIITLLVMFFLVGIISFMSVLWLSAYRKLIMARRPV